MNFASSIIKDQYSVDGLQNTGNAPFLNEGKDHWTLSILHENDVYVIDN